MIGKLKAARVDLTAALRMAAKLHLNEGVCNHFSLEVPGNPSHFLINPQGLHWSEITPSDLVIVDESGQLIEGKHQVEPTAFFIHGRIHSGKKKKCIYFNLFGRILDYWRKSKYFRCTFKRTSNY